LDVVGESVVVVKSGVVYTGSRAAIIAVGMLPYPWRLVRACRVIPWFVRDWGYYFVARHRTAWYGREDEDFCEVPSEALQDKVLR
jgi:predicted DCC family thiol-disulfide oxidoreductase YuxK